MGKIGIIIAREYASRVKKKSFILTTILVPVLLAAMIAIPALIAVYSKDDRVRDIAVLDRSKVVKGNLENSKTITYTFVEEELANEIKKNLNNTDKFYALLEISELDSTNNASISIYASDQINIQMSDKIESDINQVLKINKLKQYDIPNLEEIMHNIQTSNDLKTYKASASEDEEDKETSVVPFMAVGYISSFIIYMFIFMFGSMVMRGVIEEKNNRIVEVIVSSVKPIQLMIGKIAGIALVALTQFFVWIALTLLIVFGVSLATGKSAKAISGDSIKQSIENSAVGIGNSDIIDITNELDNTAAIENGEESAGETMNTIFSTLKEMNLFGIIITFIIYFLLGYLLYSSMFAAVGASVDNEADTQQLMLPVTIPLIIGLFIMLNAFQNPDSALAVWGSIIPFTSPMVMVARYAYGVPAWQYILSIILLVLTFLLMAWISAKIYRIGILSYGKKATWRDLIKWIKFKD